jgi:hypothetical protein
VLRVLFGSRSRKRRCTDGTIDSSTGPLFGGEAKNLEWISCMALRAKVPECLHLEIGRRLLPNGVLTLVETRKVGGYVDGRVLVPIERCETTVFALAAP